MDVNFNSSKELFNFLMGVLDTIEDEVMTLNGDVVKVSASNGNIRETARKMTNDTARYVRKELKTEKKKWTQERRDLAKQVSEMARVANKRLDRLERNGLQELSAYKAWQENGAVRFSEIGRAHV